MDSGITLDRSFERSAFQMFLKAGNTHTTRPHHICLQNMTTLYKDFNYFYASSTIRVETGSKHFLYTYIVNVVVKVRASPFKELAVLANGVATKFSAPDLSIIT